MNSGVMLCTYRILKFMLFYNKNLPSLRAKNTFLKHRNRYDTINSSNFFTIETNSTELFANSCAATR